MNMRPAMGLFSMAAMVAAAACGSSDSAQPTPTSVIESTDASADGRDGTGTAGTAAGAVRGAISALTGACPAVSFTIERKTVKTNAATGYGDGRCAGLANGTKVEVAGTPQADGSILAAKVRVVPTTSVPAPKPAPTPVPVPTSTPAISGAITTVSGTCPELKLTVGTKTAVTGRATVFDGRGCGDMKAGLVVSIYGEFAAGNTTLKATKVVSSR